MKRNCGHSPRSSNSIRFAGSGPTIISIPYTTDIFIPPTANNAELDPAFCSKMQLSENHQFQRTFGLRALLLIIGWIQPLAFQMSWHCFVCQSLSLSLSLSPSIVNRRYNCTWCVPVLSHVPPSLCLPPTLLLCLSLFLSLSLSLSLSWSLSLSLSPSLPPPGYGYALPAGALVLPGPVLPLRKCLWHRE